MAPRSRSLAHGRPVRLSSSKLRANMSAQKGRRLIRRHHQLAKEQSKAIAQGDVQRSERLQTLIDKQGGLEAYQAASIAGQSRDRGGDSSKILVEWLTVGEHAPLRLDQVRDQKRPWKMLEVGALANNNACSKCGLFNVTRIDLNSQSPGIDRQDFMDRPIPADDENRFDLISLSLVLNFVPDARGRGEMLKRTCEFLLRSSDGHDVLPFPALFLVLPAPCVTNSRYMDEELLLDMLHSLGYKQLFRKLSSKLVYYLWKYSTLRTPTPNLNAQHHFLKSERNPGKKRNNFAVVLD